MVFALALFVLICSVVFAVVRLCFYQRDPPTTVSHLSLSAIIYGPLHACAHTYISTFMSQTKHSQVETKDIAWIIAVLLIIERKISRALWRLMLLEKPVMLVKGNMAVLR